MIKKLIILVVLVSIYACAQGRYSTPTSYTPFLGLRNYAVGANIGNGTNLNNQTIDTWAQSINAMLQSAINGDWSGVDDFATKTITDSLAEDIASTFGYVSFDVTPSTLRRFILVDKNGSPLDSISIDTNYLYINPSTFALSILPAKIAEWDADGGGTGGLFEPDGNGDLMPNDAIVDDSYYELDGNGDIQPL